MARHMVTTLDNPFNPWTQFDEWDAYDRTAGHHTMAFLARVTTSSHDLSDVDEEEAIERAVMEIVTENVAGIYRAVEIPDASLEHLREVEAS